MYMYSSLAFLHFTNRTKEQTSVILEKVYPMKQLIFLNLVNKF